MNENNWGHRRHYIGWVILAFLVLIFAAIALSAYFGSFVARPVGYPGFPFFFFPFGWIFGVFWIFIVFWAVSWIFWPRRGWWGGGYGRRYWGYTGYGDEYQILRQRYARGEITKEQFDQMTNDLRQHAAPAS